MEGLDSALEMDLAVSDDDPESCLSQKTANTLGSAGSLAVDGLQDMKGSDALFGAFMPQPVVPFSKRPPKAVEDIYKSLPSVESLFPDWPFHPLELPQSIPKWLNWKIEEKLKSQQGWNRELTLTRVHAPDTAAYRLLNHSFKQDVKGFSEEYEAYRRSGFQTLPDQQRMITGRPMPYLSGVFECSICRFSPNHNDIPNWLYYTKFDENSPRYLYCLSCKAGDRDAQVKSFSNLMAKVKEIVAICHAEEEVKAGMGNATTSVPYLRFQRYEIMFGIEVEAAMVRGAIKAAEIQFAKNAEGFRQWQLETIPGDVAVGKAVAKGVVGHYFTAGIPRLFGAPGQLVFPIRMDSRDQQTGIYGKGEVYLPARKSHTPPGWPKGYNPPVIADNVYQGNDSQASLPRPPTPVWFTERQTTPTTSPSPTRSTTPPGYPQWLVPSLDRGSVLYASATRLTDTSTLRSTTPPGYPEWFTLQPSAPYEELDRYPEWFTPQPSAPYEEPDRYPEWFTPQPSAPYEEPDMFTDTTTASTARSSIIGPDEEPDMSTDATNVSTARSSIIGPEVHIPFQNFSAFIHPEDPFPGDHTLWDYAEGAATLTHPDTPMGSLEDNEPLSLARSSRTPYENYIPQVNGACDNPGSSARSSVTPPEGFGQKPAGTVVKRSLRRLLEIFHKRLPVDDKQENQRIPPVKAKLPQKTERNSPVKSEGASYHKSEVVFPQKAKGTSFYRPRTKAQPAAQIGRASFFNNLLPKLDRAILCKYKPNATIPPKIERRSLYKCKNHNIESTGPASSHESLSRIAEEKLEDHPESEFSDTSTEPDSDESFEPPRILRCMNPDEPTPSRLNEYTRRTARVPMGRRARHVDLKLNSILEGSEPE